MNFILIVKVNGYNIYRYICIKNTGYDQNMYQNCKNKLYTIEYKEFIFI